VRQEDLFPGIIMRVFLIHNVRIRKIIIISFDYTHAPFPYAVLCEFTYFSIYAIINLIMAKAPDRGSFPLDHFHECDD